MPGRLGRTCHLDVVKQCSSQESESDQLDLWCPIGYSPGHIMIQFVSDVSLRLVPRTGWSKIQRSRGRPQVHWMIWGHRDDKAVTPMYFITSLQDSLASILEMQRRSSCSWYFPFPTAEPRQRARVLITCNNVTINLVTMVSASKIKLLAFRMFAIQIMAARLLFILAWCLQSPSSTFILAKIPLIQPSFLSQSHQDKGNQHDNDYRQEWAHVLFLTSYMRGSNGNVANVGQQRQHDALNCRQGFDFESVVILRLISF